MSAVSETSEPIGVIAGSRSLPIIFAREARASGLRKIVAVGFEGETDPLLASLVDEIVWLRVGQLSKMIRAFTDRGVRRCVMLGQIAPKNLFHLRPDLRAMGLLLKLKEKNAHTIFGAIADELERDGVKLIEAVPWMGNHMPGAGFRLGPALDDNQQAGVNFGFQIAKEVSGLEIGQTVVVKDGVVLAVEAFEGTDQCLRRGGALSGRSGSVIAVKVTRANHDLRFDIPCLGATTIETCREAGIAVFAFEAGRALLLDREDVEKLSRRHGITIVSV